MSGCTHPTGRIGGGIDTARYGHHVTFLGEELQPVAPDLPHAAENLGAERRSADEFHGSYGIRSSQRTGNRVSK